MTDEIVVEATPIETDVQRVGEFGAWVADAQQRADAALDRYRPAPIGDEAGYGRAKKERAAIRKVRGEIDAERKLRLREVEDALKALKEQVKEVTGPLDEADREYKRLMDEWDEAKREERARALAQEYEDMAPALADMLPYGRMAAICDPEGRWLLRSVGDKAAVDLMAAAAQRVVADYETVAALDMTDEERTEVRAEFFRTLDLPAAIRHANDLRAERERIAAFEEERRQREEEARRAAEERERAAEAARAAQAAERERQAAEARDNAQAAAGAPVAPRMSGTITPEEYDALPDEIRGFKRPGRPPVAVEMAARPEPGEEVPEYAVIAYVNSAKRAALVAFCKENGIRGRAVATHGRALEIRRWDD
jgi:hypothetical protein